MEDSEEEGNTKRPHLTTAGDTPHKPEDSLRTLLYNAKVAKN